MMVKIGQKKADDAMSWALKCGNGIMGWESQQPRINQGL
jgi:hypothetical protein